MVCYFAFFKKNVKPAYKISYSIPEELLSFVEGKRASDFEIYNFFDYSCPYCKETERILSELKEEFGNKFQINHVPIPLAGENSITYRAAALSICYYRENKNVNFHKYLIKNQENLESALNFTSGYFQSIDSNTIKKLSNCVETESYKNSLLANKRIASEMNINSVPVTVIGRELYVGLLAEKDYRNLIEKHIIE